MVVTIIRWAITENVVVSIMWHFNVDVWKNIKFGVGSNVEKIFVFQFFQLPLDFKKFK